MIDTENPQNTVDNQTEEEAGSGQASYVAQEADDSVVDESVAGEEESQFDDNGSLLDMPIADSPNKDSHFINNEEGNPDNAMDEREIADTRVDPSVPVLKEKLGIGKYLASIPEQVIKDFANLFRNNDDKFERTASAEKNKELVESEKFISKATGTLLTIGQDSLNTGLVAMGVSTAVSYGIKGLGFVLPQTRAISGAINIIGAIAGNSKVRKAVGSLVGAGLYVGISNRDTEEESMDKVETNHGLLRMTNFGTAMLDHIQDVVGIDAREDPRKSAMLSEFFDVLTLNTIFSIGGKAVKAVKDNKKISNASKMLEGLERRLEMDGSSEAEKELFNKATEIFNNKKYPKDVRNNTVIKIAEAVESRNADELLIKLTKSRKSLIDSVAGFQDTEKTVTDLTASLEKYFTEKKTQLSSLSKKGSKAISKRLASATEDTAKKSTFIPTREDVEHLLLKLDNHIFENKGNVGRQLSINYNGKEAVINPRHILSDGEILNSIISSETKHTLPNLHGFTSAYSSRNLSVFDLKKGIGKWGDYSKELKAKIPQGTYERMREEYLFMGSGAGSTIPSRLTPKQQNELLSHINNPILQKNNSTIVGDAKNMLEASEAVPEDLHSILDNTGEMIRQLLGSVELEKQSKLLSGAKNFGNYALKNIIATPATALSVMFATIKDTALAVSSPLFRFAGHAMKTGLEMAGGELDFKKNILDNKIMLSESYATLSGFIRGVKEAGTAMKQSRSFNINPVLLNQSGNTSRFSLNAVNEQVITPHGGFMRNILKGVNVIGDTSLAFMHGVDEIAVNGMREALASGTQSRMLSELTVRRTISKESAEMFAKDMYRSIKDPSLMKKYSSQGIALFNEALLSPQNNGLATRLLENPQDLSALAQLTNNITHSSRQANRAVARLSADEVGASIYKLLDSRATTPIRFLMPFVNGSVGSLSLLMSSFRARTSLLGNPEATKEFLGVSFLAGGMLSAVFNDMDNGYLVSKETRGAVKGVNASGNRLEAVLEKELGDQGYKIKVDSQGTKAGFIDHFITFASATKGAIEYLDRAGDYDNISVIRQLTSLVSYGLVKTFAEPIESSAGISLASSYGLSKFETTTTQLAKIIIKGMAIPESLQQSLKAITQYVDPDVPVGEDGGNVYTNFLGIAGESSGLNVLQSLFKKDPKLVQIDHFGRGGQERNFRFDRNAEVGSDNLYEPADLFMIDSKQAIRHPSRIILDGARVGLSYGEGGQYEKTKAMFLNSNVIGVVRAVLAARYKGYDAKKPNNMTDEMKEDLNPRTRDEFRYRSVQAEIASNVNKIWNKCGKDVVIKEFIEKYAAQQANARQVNNNDSRLNNKNSFGTIS